MKADKELMEKMHHDHMAWASEHALWLEEAMRWQEQHREAVTMLQELQRALSLYAAACEEHVPRLQHAEAESCVHEKCIKALEEWDISSDSPEMIEKHDKAGRAHEDNREAHAQIKKRHRAVLAELRRFGKSIGATH